LNSIYKIGGDSEWQQKKVAMEARLVMQGKLAKAGTQEKLAKAGTQEKLAKTGTQGKVVRKDEIVTSIMRYALNKYIGLLTKLLTGVAR
jgi:hypothetical protein